MGQKNENKYLINYAFRDEDFFLKVNNKLKQGDYDGYLQYIFLINPS